jgi:hypothetical protein
MPDTDFKSRTTESLINELHRRGPQNPVGQIPKHLIDLRERLVSEAPPEEKDRVRSHCDEVLRKDGPMLLASVQKQWDYDQALRKELATRPHIMRPYQKRAKRQAAARQNRGGGKSKNR